MLLLFLVEPPVCEAAPLSLMDWPPVRFFSEEEVAFRGRLDLGEAPNQPMDDHDEGWSVKKVLVVVVVVVVVVVFTLQEDPSRQVPKLRIGDDGRNQIGRSNSFRDTA